MVRVLKPGGWLLTVADSFKGSGTESVEVDFQQWDTHPMVLGGVNEQILRMDSVLERLALHAGALVGHVFLRDGNSGHYQRLTLDEARDLVRQRPRVWGLMALRIQKLKSTETPQHRMRRGRIPMPAITRAVLETEGVSEGYAALAKLLRPEALRSTLPVQEASRFLQLNGWRWPLPGQPWRLAYRRGRLFMHRQSEHSHLLIEAGLPAVAGHEKGSLRVLLNGHLLRAEEVQRGLLVCWYLPLPPGEGPCCVEIELGSFQSAAGASQVIPAGHLVVRKVEFGGDAAFFDEGERVQCLPRATLAALLSCGVMERTVQVWAGTQVEAALQAVAAFRRNGLAVSLHCRDEEWSFYQVIAGQRNAGLNPAKAVFFVGMDAMEAKELMASHSLAKAWIVNDEIASDLAVEQPFGEQLDAVPSPEVASLRREAAKLKSRLATTEAKLQEARDRISRLKAEAARPKRRFWKRWQQLWTKPKV